ncbi:MAG: STAS domain-containing protein [Candidatus Cloacimonetes bacterium]|jgi:anti-sigma B factor antagonist|nr:STAS domain-containing protein [Candidatus Cloacimonadota bacterium]MCB5286323.1 STAS domain-containing protein [Candidatus Cloacimonadota bacterium]MCK9184030.1 STAS domain-containing protein [Candidatus Cloacimonadota bacterium]MCK9583722.1 STAS domain-containing protein [Candidatus Cloacimonadota bacterium]MDY0228645.1 STAS domain-containing protein [Candidatus Cloacimonadaceae bacterium]
MNINYRQENRIGIIELKGRLDAYSAPQLRGLFSEVADKAVNFVFDLKECDFIDSTGLGTIVACLKSASQGGGDIYIANLQEKPRMVFDITRAHRIFHIFDDLETALLGFDQDLGE